MPSRWQVLLPGIDPSRVRLEHLHAVVSGWFDHDSDAHQAPVKPYSITAPAPAADPGGVLFEVGLLNDAFIDRLHSRAAPGVAVRIGGQRTRFGGPPRQVAALPWAQAQSASTADAWCLRFVTPTTFRRGNAFTPWPAPKAVLGSLRTAWRRFAPAELPQPVLDMSTDPVWVTDIDGANEVVTVNDRTVSGFVGRIRFTCDAGPETAAAVDRLVRLAPYAGVGAWTTRGFGVVRTEPTWRQRRSS